MSRPIPRFQEGQLVLREDLLAERAARLERRWRHGRAQHGAGILSGLELEIVDGEPILRAGAALDGRGRLLVVAAERLLFAEARPRPSTAYAVWLGFAQDQSREAAPGRARRRCTETAAVTLLRIPATLSPQALAALRSLGRTGIDADPADPAVFLGRLEIAANGSVTVDREGVVFAGAQGEAIAAPSGTALLTLGHNPDAPAERLGLRLEGRGSPPVWSIDRAGRTRFAHALRIEGDLLQESRAPTAVSVPGAPPAGLHFSKAGVLPEEPRPWSLARVGIEEEDRPREEWRLELEDPGEQGEPKRRELVIGVPDSPALRIRPNGEVIHIDELEVTGETIRQPIAPDPASPAFAAGLTGAMLQGLLWALALGTIQTGIAGRVTLPPQALGTVEGLTVELLSTGRTTTTDADGRFFLAQVGWPGELVTLRFRDDAGNTIAQQDMPATVGALQQVFALQPGSNIEP